MMSSGTNFVMTVIGFSMSILFIVFVCTRLICARIHLNASRRAFRIATRSDLGILERGLHGLEPIAVAKFPTKKYGDTFFSSAEDAQCTICLSEYNKEDTIRILPLCGHYFHANCVDIWLQQNSTCPVCRISLREYERKHFMQPMYSSAIRYQRAMESLRAHSHQASSNVQSARTHVNDRNYRMNTIQEDQCRPENNRADAESRNNISSEDQEIPKDLTNKHVESPSTNL